MSAEFPHDLYEAFAETARYTNLLIDFRGSEDALWDSEEFYEAMLEWMEERT